MTNPEADRGRFAKTKAVLTAVTVVALPFGWIHAEDREPAAGAKAPEERTAPAPGVNAPAKKPDQSESPNPANRDSTPMDKAETATMKRVTGIGGVFIKAKDPAKLRAWYKTHLGIDVQTWGGTAFRWVDAAGVPAKGTTAWFVGNGSNFAPSDASFMIDYRVADLPGLLKLLRDEGCQVLDKVEQSDFGKFGWVMDPEGNKVELWQPPAGQ